MKNIAGLIGSEMVGPDVRAAYGLLLDAQVGEDLTPLLARVQQHLERVRSSGKYTPAGQADAVRQAGVEALTELAILHAGRRGKFLSELKKIGDGLPAKIPTALDLARDRKVDPVLLFLQLKELRDELRKIDVVNQRPLLLEAAVAGDTDLLVAAFDGHPLVRAVRSPDLLTETTAVYLDGILPPEAKVTKTALLLYDSNTAQARSFINKVTGAKAPAEDVIARQAKGEPELAA